MQRAIHSSGIVTEFAAASGMYTSRLPPSSGSGTVVLLEGPSTGFSATVKICRLKGAGALSVTVQFIRLSEPAIGQLGPAFARRV
jgi:hypothetical protein